jgi:hypothetical protein
MQIEKELISLDPLSFERIEGYLAYVKEIQLKLVKCEKNFCKKDKTLTKNLYEMHDLSIIHPT